MADDAKVQQTQFGRSSCRSDILESQDYAGAGKQQACKCQAL
jgi:hypothetical protein